MMSFINAITFSKFLQCDPIVLRKYQMSHKNMLVECISFPLSVFLSLSVITFLAANVCLYQTVCLYLHVSLCRLSRLSVLIDCHIHT